MTEPKLAGAPEDIWLGSDRSRRPELIYDNARDGPWGTVMDRITESLLDEFSKEHDISGLTQDRRFEHFVSYITVRRQYSETFDTEEIVTGAGGDIGIDAIAIIVNGNLVTDRDSLSEVIAGGDHLDVMFIFVQASRSAGFDGDIIHSIFYDNVRDWQGENAVNTEIGSTLASDHKARFALMNNGVTVIARNLQLTGNKFHIEDFQIVNGCQTSHVLFNQRDHVDVTVMIPLRLISTQDEGVVESIIRATNRQTEVRPEQFFAVTEFAKQLESYFRTFGNGRKLFYERRSRQYDRLDIERTRIVTPRNMIRAFASMFLNEPHRTTRNYARLLDRVGNDIFAEGHKPDPYYVAAYSLYKLEFLFRATRLDVKFKPSRYHLLLAARLLANSTPSLKLNARDMEKYCKVITEVLWDAEAADNLFAKAAEAAEIVSNGDLSGDNVRTQKFTEDLIKYLEPKPR